MCVLTSVCVCVAGTFLQTSGDSSLTTIISDLQSTRQAKAQGHLRTQTFFFFLSPLFHPFPSVLSSSHPSLSLLPHMYLYHPFPLTPSRPKPKPCPPLTQRLLSVNSFFLFLVCWPRLTYFSLSLFQLSVCRLPFCLFGSCPISLLLSLGNTKCLHMGLHKHMYCT